jgi:hypothetical protein
MPSSRRSAAATPAAASTTRTCKRTSRAPSGLTTKPRRLRCGGGRPPLPLSESGPRSGPTTSRPSSSRSPMIQTSGPTPPAPQCASGRSIAETTLHVIQRGPEPSDVGRGSPTRPVSASRPVHLRLQGTQASCTSAAPLSRAAISGRPAVAPDPYEP